MAQEKDDQRPELDLDAEARAALEEARAMPHGPERAQAMRHVSGTVGGAGDEFGGRHPQKGQGQIGLGRKTVRHKPEQ